MIFNDRGTHVDNDLFNFELGQNHKPKAKKEIKELETPKLSRKTGGRLQIDIKKLSIALNAGNTNRDKVNINKSTKSEFGLFKVTIKVGLILVPLILIQIGFYQQAIRKADQIHNTVGIVNLMVDYYSTFSQARSSLMAYILFNNTLTVNGMSSRDAYVHLSGRLRDEILPRISNVKSTDLGNLTKTYTHLMTDYNYCEQYSKLPFFRNITCGVAKLSFLSTNILGVLKGLSNIMDEGFETITRTGNTFESVRELMNSPRFKYWYVSGSIDYLVTDVYKVVMLEVSRNLQTMLEKEKLEGLNCEPNCSMLRISAKSSDVILSITISTLILAFFLLLYRFAIISELENILRIFDMTSLLIQPNIILDNPLLSRLLKR